MSDKKAEYHECKQIDELLTSNGVKHDAGYTYHVGWSDERVAKKVGVKPSSVAGFRRKYYGNHASLPQPDSIEARIAQLEGQMFHLYERMAAAESIVSDLGGYPAQRIAESRKQFAPFPG